MSQSFQIKEAIIDFPLVDIAGNLQQAGEESQSFQIKEAIIDRERR
jgi:hypothetical protein